jgi:hypothetical protein
MLAPTTRQLNGRAFCAQRDSFSELTPPPFLPSKAEFAQRRLALALSLPPGSMAVVPAAELRMMSQNIPYRYRQSSDLRYLCGFPESGAVLLVTRSPADHIASTLFIQVNTYIHTCFTAKYVFN